MKRISFYLLLLLFCTALSSCNKELLENPTTEIPDLEKATDRVSFHLDGQTYTFTNRYGSSITYKPVNIKAYAAPIANGKLAYHSSDRYWYGASDLTALLVRYDFSSGQAAGDFRITFSKIFKDSQMDSGSPLLSLEPPHAVIKLGPYRFSVDHEQANTQDGVFIELSNKEIPGRLISGIPGSPVSSAPSLDSLIQHKSSFELTKLEALEDGRYLIEAQFSLQLFDAVGKAHQLTGGFLSMKILSPPILKAFR